TRQQTPPTWRAGFGCGPARPIDSVARRSLVVRTRPVRRLLSARWRCPAAAPGAALRSVRCAAHWAEQRRQRRDTPVSDEVANAVEECARAAKSAAPSLAAAPDAAIDSALRDMAQRLTDERETVLAANSEDVARATAEGMSAGLLDRLTITDERLTDMAEQLRALAGSPHQQRDIELDELDQGRRLVERRRPVGVLGANYEARPNVTVDIASQLVKSRNAGVLRTGSAALGSAGKLLDVVVAPALRQAGIDPD